MKIKSALIAIGLLAGVGTAFAVPLCTLTVTNLTGHSLSSNFAGNQMIGKGQRVVIGGGKFFVPCNLSPNVLEPIPGVSVSTSTSGLTPHYVPQAIGAGNVELKLVARGSNQFQGTVGPKNLNCEQYGFQKLGGYYDHVSGGFRLCIPVK